MGSGGDDSSEVIGVSFPVSGGVDITRARCGEPRQLINMVIEHLTDQGAMDPALLYEPPFTYLAPTGPEKLFDEEKVARLVTRIRAINDSAVA